MAKAKTLRFGEFVLEIQTGVNTWSKPCGVRSRGFNRSAAMAETEVPDCEDEDLPPDIERDITSRSSEISIAGVLDTEDLDLWDEWWDEGDTKNVRITVPGNEAAGGRTYVQPFKLANYNQTGERGQRVGFEATLQSDGALVRTNAAA